MKFYIQLKRERFAYCKGLMLSKKTIMRINLTCIILMLTLLQVSASGFAQKISLSEKNITLQQLFKEIKTQSGYDFLYETGELRNAKRVNIDVVNEDLKKVLDEIFLSQPLTYSIDQNTIVIRKKDRQRFESVFEFLKLINIKGKVTDANGLLLSGATIQVKGGGRGIITDAQGEFEMNNVNKGQVLVVSFVGYKTKEVTVGDSENITVVLELNPAQLEAVTVVSTGYQTLSKERATGSYDVVGQEILSKRPVSNISTALQGTVAGLQARENQDGSVSFLLRGAGTMSTNASQPLNVTQPLVVVDGFAIAGFDFNNINQNDVESITVLKDAAALSIWGSRGANGVIVIQTKKAKGGKSQVDVQAFTRVSDMINLDQVMRQANSADHIKYEKLAFDRNLFLSQYAGGFMEIGKSLTLAQEQMFAFKNGSITETQMNAELARLSAIDNRSQLREQLMQRALVNQANINFLGGNDKLQTAASLLYENNQEGFKYRGYDRFVLNVNNSFNATRFLSLNFGVNVSYRKNNASGSSVGELEGLSPYELLLNDDGSYGVNLRNYNRLEMGKLPLGSFPYQDWSYNLLREVRGRELINDNISARFQGGINVRILSGLSFDGKVQYERRKTTSSSGYNEETFEVRNQVNTYVEYNDATKVVGRTFIPKGGILRSSQGEYEGLSLRAQFNYDKVIDGRHQITAVAGTEVVDELTTGITNPTAYGYFPEKNQVTTPPYGYGSAVDQLRTFTSTTAAATIAGGNTVLSWGSNRLAGFYGNFSYSFDGKYTLSGSARSDASNFVTDDPKLRWTPLWHIGAMWNIGSEEFMKPLTWLDRLNVRFTYGSTGYANQTVSTKTLISISTSPSTITNTITGTLGTPGNAFLRWERTYSTNLAVDFSMFSRRLSGKVEVYNKDGRDIVGNISLPAVTGATSARVNNAGISNRGIEIELGTLVNINRDFTYNTNITYSYNQNKITKLFFPALLSFDMLAGQYVEGRPVGSVYSYKYLGMIDGVPHVEGPNQIPSSMNSVALHNTGLGRTFLQYEGTSIPPHTLGWINNFRYKNFNLMTVVTGTMGGKFRRPIFNYATVVGSSKTTVDRFVADVFAGDPSIPQFPKLDELNFYLWDRYTPNLDGLVESSSFIELKEINLEYSLPKSIANKVSLSNIRLFAQARNLGLLYTNNSENYHPEWLPGTYRPVRNYTLGLNLQF
ncbi:SusC/RagA family TonB-linked outer membrane protein [Pedobacter frigoris]|uniref:SusC/RagA family TonB-linked outer membrane protein n=1 Tax=Pedobacter frigoris TaxID=2571272 RepID=UPI00292D1C71|nr:SusC/RagA family TonB-linked outer membrane protein [Pedobacter frigoris]